MITIEALNSWGAVWAGFMTRALVDASAVLALLLVVWLPLRRRMSAQLAYGLFCLVLLKVFVPVPTTWVPPVPLREAIERVAGWERRELPAVNTLELPMTGDLATAAPEVAPVGTARLVSPRTAATTTPGARSSLATAALLMLGWAGLSLLLSVRFLRGLASTRRLIRDAIPLGAEWLPIDLDALQRASGVRGMVRWAVSPRLTSPAVGGLLRPTVILPPDIDDGLTPKQLTWVLLHELAHIRRGDLWVVIAQRIAQAFFFFHPAVHVANWIIDQLREYACDDAALAACQTSRHDCGEGFLTIVGRSVDRAAAAAPALGLFESRMLVKRRLLRILDKRRPVHGRLSPRAAAGLLATALLVLPFGTHRDVLGTSQGATSGSAATRTAESDGDRREPVNFGPAGVWRSNGGGPAQARIAIPAIAYSPDGSVLVIAGEDGLIWVRDVASGKVVQRLEGHRDAVSCLAFSPDGKRLASGSFDRTLKLWDVASGRPLATLAGHSNWVLAVAFSPGGALLASAGHDRSARLWETGTGKELRTLSDHGGSVRSLAFAPDGRTLATGGADRSITLWDPRTGRLRSRFEGHKATVRALAYAADGMTLASAGEDGEAKLWDVASGRERAALAGHTDMVVCLGFSPRGGVLATGSLDATVKLWDTRTGREQTTLVGHTEGVSALAFAPGGGQIATGSLDGSVRRWEPTPPVFSPAACLPCPDEVGSVAFTADGRSLFAASQAGVTRWDTPSGTAAASLSPAGLAIAVAPNGKTYCAGGSDGTLRLYDTASGRERAALTGHQRAVTSVAFAPSGRWIASSAQDGLVRLWDLATRGGVDQLPATAEAIACVRISPDGRTLAVVRGEGSTGSVLLWDVAARAERGTLQGVNAVAFAPDGKTLATANAEGTITLRDPATFAPQATLSQPSCLALAFSPDGRLLATTRRDGDVALWHVRGGRQLGVLRGHRGAVRDVAFAPDGRSLATGGQDHTVKLWNLASRRQTARATLKGDLGTLWTVAYSPDGRTLAVADGPMDEPGTITLWDVKSRRVRTTLAGHQRGVATAVFAPNGKTVASGSWDGTIRLWDTATGQTRYEVPGLNGVIGLAFSPDGKQLASAGEGKLVALWDVDTGAEIARLTDFQCDVQCVAFSPDGRQLATGGGTFGDGGQARSEVKLWDVARRSAISTLAGHTHAVVALAFAPDGRTLATGSADQSVRFWNLDLGQPRLTLSGLPNCVQALAFSRDGRTLAWAGRGDGLVALHDAATGVEVGRLVGHAAVVRSIAFAPDGSGVATVSADRSIKLWDTPSFP